MLIVPALAVAEATSPPTRTPPTVGIGVGYDGARGVDLSSPNAASVRFATSPRVWIEGVFHLRTDRIHADDEGASSTTSYFGSVGLDGRALLRLGRRNDTELYLAGLVGIAHDRQQLEWGGADMTAKTTAYSFGYGLELQHWLGERFAIGASADTELLSVWHKTQDQGGRRRAMYHGSLAWRGSRGCV